MITQQVTIRLLGRQDYHTCWEAMRDFTQQRHEQTVDEIWIVEHPPVFTQGQNGKPEHIINSGDIPIVQTDRGGQVTYHGPGQLMVYTLVDLKRKQFNIRELVTHLEQAVVAFLMDLHINAYAKCDAPGVYVNNTVTDDPMKICSIGLRIRRGCSYHGLAFNISMDLTPFSRINPCGFHSLKMTQLADLCPEAVPGAQHKLLNYLMKNLGYTMATFN